jgi:hypothetical protein
LFRILGPGLQHSQKDHFEEQLNDTNVMFWIVQ